MADPDTGVPVPILGVTIHPQTGLVYPLGGLHVCPITSLPQPIQIGCPLLDSRSGKLVLTVGVGLDPVTGQHRGRGGLRGRCPGGPCSESVCVHRCRSCGASWWSSPGRVLH